MWDSAARAAASERPTLRQTTVLPARAHRSSAADERVRPAHGLEEEADRLRPLVLGEEREVVGRVGHGLGSRGHDATEPDPTAERQERVSDRAGLTEHRDAAGSRRFGRAPDPGHEAVRDDDAHAVRPDHRRPDLSRARREALDRRSRVHSGLGSDARHDEGSHACGRGILERLLDALVVDEQERGLRRLGQVGEGREARGAPRPRPGSGSRPRRGHRCGRRSRRPRCCAATRRRPRASEGRGGRAPRARSRILSYRTERSALRPLTSQRAREAHRDPLARRRRVPARQQRRLRDLPRGVPRRVGHARPRRRGATSGTSFSRGSRSTSGASSGSRTSGSSPRAGSSGSARRASRCARRSAPRRAGWRRSPRPSSSPAIARPADHGR